MDRSEGLATVFISLGSNLGDKLANLLAALRLLQRSGQVWHIFASSCYQTAPWGFHEQDSFYNAIIRLQTCLLPEQLLGLTQQIELMVGPEAKAANPSGRWGPRSLDLDLMLWGDEVICTEQLIVPHPLLAARAFVLRPLAEIAPELIVPGAGRSVGFLLAALPDKDEPTLVNGQGWVSGYQVAVG